MSQDLTQNLPNSFAERVLTELAAIRQENAQTNAHLVSLDARLTSLETRVVSIERRVVSIETRLTSLEDRSLSIDSRLISLEDKVDARLHETRPIWEGVLQSLTEIEKNLSTLTRHFQTMVREEFDLRSRIQKLEDDQQAV